MNQLKIKSMKLSPFNPILFHDIAEIAPQYKDYIQIYAPEDRIGFEIIHSSTESLEPLTLLDSTGNVIMDLSWNRYDINSSQAVSFYEFENLEAGEYYLSFGSLISYPIIVTDNREVLDKTVIIQYSTSSNVTRTNVYSVINGRIRYFEKRFFGGFKDNGWLFSVENEQYITQDSDIVELYSIESTDKILTIGESAGEPLFIGEILNHIFLCDLMFIDGNRYSISNDSSLDSEPVNEYGDRFVFSITLRMARAINATFERQLRSLFRKTPTHIRRAGRSIRKI